jgi:hypothetical protein
MTLDAHDLSATRRQHALVTVASYALALGCGKCKHVSAIALANALCLAGDLALANALCLAGDLALTDAYCLGGDLANLLPFGCSKRGTGKTGNGRVKAGGHRCRIAVHDDKATAKWKRDRHCVPL